MRPSANRWWLVALGVVGVGLAVWNLVVALGTLWAIVGILVVSATATALTLTFVWAARSQSATGAVLAIGTTIVLVAGFGVPTFVLWSPDRPATSPQPGNGVAPTPSKVTQSQIELAINSRQLPAEYVFLLDASVSMREEVNGHSHFQRSVSALRGELSSLGPGDKITLITFAERPTLRFSGKSIADAQDLLARLAPPIGQSTDILAAIDASIGILNEPGAIAPASITVFTDNRQTAESRLTVNRLREEATALKRRRSISSQSILLPGADRDDLLRQIFGDTQVVVGGPTQVKVSASQAIADAKTGKLAGYLDSDTPEVSLTIDLKSVRVEGDETLMAVTATSRSRYVPLTLSTLSAFAESTALNVRTTGGSVSLAPGASRSINVRVSAEGGRSLPDGVNVTDVVLRGAVGSPWASFIETDLGLAFTPGTTSKPARIPIASSGQAPRLASAAWLLVLLSILLVVGWSFPILSSGRRIRGLLIIEEGEVVYKRYLRNRRLELGPRTTGGMVGGQLFIKSSGPMWSRSRRAWVTYIGPLGDPNIGNLNFDFSGKVVARRIPNTDVKISFEPESATRQDFADDIDSQ